MSDKGSDNRARERLKESLSATFDGQASELELRRVLDGLASDTDLRETAKRYQRIGDAVRKEANSFANVDLSTSVMSALANEKTLGVDTTLGPQRSLGFGRFAQVFNNWGGSFGRVAVAASVVFAVIIGVRGFNTVENVSLVADSNPATLTQPIQVSNNGYGASGILAGYNTGTQTEGSISPEQLAYAQSVADRATRERFRAYALQHAELSVMNSGQGVLPFARLTSFDVQ